MLMSVTMSIAVLIPMPSLIIMDTHCYISAHCLLTTRKYTEGRGPFMPHDAPGS